MIGVADSAGLAHDHAQISPICVAHADYHGIAGADHIGGTVRAYARPGFGGRLTGESA